MNLPPSTFTCVPWNSIAAKCETETIARNIMVIRKRLGDAWPLTWEQYQAERRKDGGFSELERGHFDTVMKLIPDAVGAIAFCPDWAKAAREALKT